MHPNFKNIPKQTSVPNALTTQHHSKFQAALALHQRGHLSQAQALYADLLKIQPRHADALHLLGVIAAQSDDPQKAVELIGKAIAIRPDCAEPYYNRGIALKKLRQLDLAVASYSKAIAIKPDYAEAHYNLGIALQELQQLDLAVASYSRAIAIKPDYAEAHYNRGNALRELKLLDAAVDSYNKAIAIQPDRAAAYSNRGLALQELNQFDAAIASYDEAIAIRPDYAEALSNRGNSLLELKLLDAAVASFNKAIAIKPDYAEAHYNRGNALLELKLLAAAVESYNKAIAIQPDYAEAYWNKALALLINGDFEEGWELHEWRWKRHSLSSPRRNFSEPLWLGSELLNGKTILLHSEHGLGDTIQFCRYASLVSDLGVRVILEVEESLIGLLSGLTGITELIVKGATLPPFDYHCPLMSLPLALKTRLDTVPSSHKYLNVGLLKATQWKDLLGEKTMPRVGLVWSGNPAHTGDGKRSVLLSELMPHLPVGCQYVSLQKEVRDVDKLSLVSNPHICHFGDQLRDFTDTAALCELMDIVISVDTSVAHLSAALGKSTWVLLPHLPDWRWLLDTDQSPWYPSVKLYRQPSSGDWISVFSKVKADLAWLIAHNFGTDV